MRDLMDVSLPPPNDGRPYRSRSARSVTTVYSNARLYKLRYIIL